MLFTRIDILVMESSIHAHYFGPSQRTIVSSPVSLFRNRVAAFTVYACATIDDTSAKCFPYRGPPFDETLHRCVTIRFVETGEYTR
jgi:hypothetical protein